MVASRMNAAGIAVSPVLEGPSGSVVPALPPGGWLLGDDY